MRATTLSACTSTRCSGRPTLLLLHMAGAGAHEALRLPLKARPVIGSRRLASRRAAGRVRSLEFERLPALEPHPRSLSSRTMPSDPRAG